VPRALHPGAWWLWALGLAAAASRTLNPLLLLLVVAVAGFVVSARRGNAPWSRSFSVYLRLGLLVVAIRLTFQILLGSPVPGHTLVTLPSVPLPAWLAGVRLGGPVTAEAVAGALYEALQLTALLACVGAANALADPRRLLRYLPGALYEAGVAVVVAMTFSPQLLEAVTRVREARRLRGRPDRGLRGLRGVAMPVLQDALDRSVELAAAMDSRGYGRGASVPRAARRLTALLTVGGLVGVCVGVYGLLDGGSPPLMRFPLLGAGLAAAVAGLALGGRRSVRTRYRPDPWAAPEWLVAASGVLAGTAFVVASATGVGGLAPSTQPLVAPGLPLLPAAGLLLALAPAWVAPRLPESARPARPRARRRTPLEVGR
jgi:energy-coupling factor transport system permease protein